MARISTYNQDLNVSKGDKLIGSDSSGSTKNFSLESISTFFKETNAGGAVAQFVWQNKSTTPNSGELQPTFSSGTTFANLTKIRVNKLIKGDDVNSLENILAVVAGKDVIIVETSDQNNFGVYSASAVLQVGSTNNYDITLVYKNSGNGSLINDKHYSLIVFGGTGGDKNTVKSFQAADFGGTETVNGSSMSYVDFTHNLGKKPSISVTEAGSPDQIAFVPVKYINDNTTRVYFTGTTSGTILAN